MSRRTAWIVFTLVVLLAVGQDIRLALDPAQYYFRNDVYRANWSVSIGRVAFVACVMLCEAAIVAFAFFARRPAARWLRALLALVPLAPWGYLTLVSTMSHSPAYLLFHHAWLWFWILVLAVGLLADGFRRIFALTTARGERPASSQDAADRV